MRPSNKPIVHFSIVAVTVHVPLIRNKGTFSFNANCSLNAVKITVLVLPLRIKDIFFYKTSFSIFEETVQVSSIRNKDHFSFNASFKPAN